MNPLKPLRRIFGVENALPDGVVEPSAGDDPVPLAQTVLRLDRLELTNVFGFEHAAFHFDGSFNLIVGVNGCGKTSLLQAIVGAVALPVNGVSAVRNYWIMDNLRNVRSTVRETKDGRVRLEKIFPARLDAKGVINQKDYDWFMERTSESSTAVERTNGLLSALEPVVRSAESLLPVVAFYSSDRRWNLNDRIRPEEAVDEPDKRSDGYTGWMNASSDMAGLQKWVTAKSLERLESVSRFVGVQSSELFKDDELGIVNRAVALALPGSMGLSFDMRFRKLVVIWSDREPTAFEDLSDGQRGVCALVADIARRMCLLNPQAGPNVTRDTPGVVVIDELDMHLHPAWQRRIVGVLRKAFPRVQFFAATHSPLIIGEVPSSNILLLRRDGRSTHPERSYGLDSNEVLEEVMGSSSRNDAVTNSLVEIHRLLDSEMVADAQSRLDSLKADVGEIPEVIQLQSEIESLRMLGDSDE
ncbi:AAA family ATPase [Paraburkholderia phenazinium]|jgi:predicted ATP-binding protein involved in virulence|uniref:Predicted ATP-binding protein involved in virulence n=1 Tax=Paraburkholderia phenazinium TaxID=60549 RepID=A0A1N6KQY7_9BURK|nr:AAA family ATPase [Paraburkholderia phenazinium]SIO58944.1 Predicted ATP-binding protein involved in virulence [Paraburkholderia phenazinium]